MPPSPIGLSVYQNDQLTQIANLNGSGATDIKLFHFCLGEPNIQENIRQPWNQDGEVVTKRRERPRLAHVILHIPNQPTMSDLRLKIEQVRDAFFNDRYFLRVQYPGDAAKFYKIYSTHLGTPRRELEEARNSIYHKAIDRWEFEPKIEHKASSDTRYAIF